MSCDIKSRTLCDDENCLICFEKSFASYPKAKYWSDKNDVKARSVFKSSHKKYLFDCDCDHEFTISLGHASHGKWCPYCCNTAQKLCDNEKCIKCYEKSFASHPKSKFWSSKNNIHPRFVLKQSNKKYLFDCKCGHEFMIQLDSVIKERWCSYCCKPTQKLCDDENCKLCFNNSFASHPKFEFWSDKNEVKPRYVSMSTHKKYLFDCECGHEIMIELYSIVAGSWCPFCCKNTLKLCDDENCKLCFDNSFASHPKSNFWSDKNELSSRNVTKSSNKKYLFNCNHGHEFESGLGSIIRGRWCPRCFLKTEAKLYDYLEQNNYSFINQAKFNWCKNIKCLPYDFLIDNFKLIIELDGRQHFEMVKNWGTPEEAHERDLFKTSKAVENGYSIIRILQEDVYNDVNDWKNKLIKYIRSYDRPTCVFINNTDEYKKLNKDMEELKNSGEHDIEIVVINNFKR